MNKQVITLGAGCFWCVENIFARIKGVESAVSGYADGDIENPTYEQVCSGKTNHAEVVQISFDADIVSLADILTVFFGIHDPTTVDRQGDDIGSQYRSTIIYHSGEQAKVAESKIVELNKNGEFATEIVTKVVPISIFYSAESYHQDYYNNNNENRYCQLVVAKKIQKFLANFPHLLQES